MPRDFNKPAHYIKPSKHDGPYLFEVREAQEEIYRNRNTDSVPGPVADSGTANTDGTEDA